LGDNQIAIDPGIAFGKSHAEDLAVIGRLGELTSLGLPVFLAHSRKNFIGSVSGLPPSDRDLETTSPPPSPTSKGPHLPRPRPAGARRALEFAAALTGNPRPTRSRRRELALARGASARTPPPLPRQTCPSGQRW
jgi:dihydropteroate synthase